MKPPKMNNSENSESTQNAESKDPALDESTVSAPEQLPPPPSPPSPSAPPQRAPKRRGPRVRRASTIPRAPVPVWMSIEEAAPILGFTPDALRARCRRAFEALPGGTESAAILPGVFAVKAGSLWRIRFDPK